MKNAFRMGNISVSTMLLGLIRLKQDLLSFSDRPEPLNDDPPALRFQDCWVLKYDARNRNPKWGIEIINKNNFDRIQNGGEIANRNNCNFYSEPTIENHVFKVSPKDYNNSGFDRGHIIPAGDFRSTQKSMNATFTMANICPQNSLLNRGYWANFENWIRKLHKEFHDIENLRVVTGPVYAPILVDGKWVYIHTTIGTFPKLITVPSHFFKLIIGEIYVAGSSPGMELRQLGFYSYYLFDYQ